MKNTGTGLVSAYENQRRILKETGLSFVEEWDDSCDILQANTPWLKSLSLIKKAKKQKKKVIVWTHTTAEDFKNSFHFSNPLAPFLKRYLSYVYGLADALFCPSEYTRTVLTKYGLDPAKIFVQSNGVDTEKFQKSIRKKDRAEVVGTVGLVFPKRKGVDTFLALAENFPEKKFVWFGKIFNRLLVNALPKKISVNCTFAGYVDDIVAAFASLNVFVFPSREENQGMALLEAAAMSLPLLIRDIPVYETWLIHNENCLKAKTDAEFKTQLEKLLNDPALRDRLGAAARKMAETHSLKAIAKKTLGIYQKLFAN